MSLSRKDGRDSRSPDPLDGRKDAKFVVDHHVVPGGIAVGDVAEFFFLVNVDEHAAVDGFGQAG